MFLFYVMTSSLFFSLFVCCCSVQYHLLTHVIVWLKIKAHANYTSLFLERMKQNKKMITRR